jgi:aminoglycoside phosphotransferase (APT) family kinase protein
MPEDVDVASPGIDRERVTRWLGAHVPGLRGPVEFTLIAGGRSNLTYRVTDAAGMAWALRRPPTGGVLSTAHDMSREWRFISALTGTDVPVPRPIEYCSDTEVTGAEFYVMDFVAGVVLGDAAAARPVPEAARHRAGLATVDAMVALHQVDPDDVGLGSAARRDGYLARQLKRWQRQVHQSGVADLDVLDRVHDALAARIPPAVSGIVHGDLRPGNVCYHPDGSIAAIFDWELATLGDPLADLGWLLSTWVDPADELPPTTGGPNAEPGFPSRSELVERYARGSGRDVSEVPYYLAFARWRAACIAAGVHARYLAGVMGEDDYDVAERGADVARLVEASHVTVRRLGMLQ